MTIEELNKLIKEELDAFFEADEEEGDDDIEVTTDEPEAEAGDEALDLLRQIYDMIKPQVEPEGEPEGEMDEPEMDDEGDEEEEDMDEAVGYPNHKADQISKVKADADDVNKGLNESVERFKRLANIKK